MNKVDLGDLRILSCTVYYICVKDYENFQYKCLTVFYEFNELTSNLHYMVYGALKQNIESHYCISEKFIFLRGCMVKKQGQDLATGGFTNTVLAYYVNYMFLTYNCINNIMFCYLGFGDPAKVGLKILKYFLSILTTPVITYSFKPGVLYWPESTQLTYISWQLECHGEFK